MDIFLLEALPALLFISSLGYGFRLHFKLKQSMEVFCDTLDESAKLLFKEELKILTNGLRRKKAEKAIFRWFENKTYRIFKDQKINELGYEIEKVIRQSNITGVIFNLSFCIMLASVLITIE